MNVNLDPTDWGEYKELASPRNFSSPHPANIQKEIDQIQSNISIELANLKNYRDVGYAFESEHERAYAMKLCLTHCADRPTVHKEIRDQVRTFHDSQNALFLIDKLIELFPKNLSASKHAEAIWGINTAITHLPEPDQEKARAQLRTIAPHPQAVWSNRR